MSTRSRWFTAVQVVVIVTAVVLVDVWISGYFLFRNAPEDPLQRVDAIVVLGGEHDGREDFGIRLAKEGWAPTVVLSNPYVGRDRVMERACRDVRGAEGPVEVLCPVPSPLTTRGEAIMVHRLAVQRGWAKLIVVSWQHHLPRARLIFQQCFSNEPGATVMRAVPRRYDYSPFIWEFVYVYQWGGLAKAALQGECSQPAN